MLIAAALAILGCHGGGADAPALPSARHELSASGDFYRLPFPSDARLAGGKIDVAGFPNPSGNTLVKTTLALVAELHGFGVTSGIFFQLSAPIADPRLDFAASVAPGSPIALVAVDDGAPDFLRRYPIAARFLGDGGPFGAPNLLAVLPLQGVPLLPRARYAVVVSAKLLSPSPELADLLAGRRPAGMNDEAFASYGKALAALQKGGVGDIGALTVFTTQDPVSDLATVTAAMLEKPPAPAPFKRNEQFDGFCVYESTIDMPDYQAGTPPFKDEGGGWKLEGGKPLLQRQEKANFVVTIPRAAMPPKGYPVVVFSRTGGGGERPLVDRGVQGMTGGPALLPGTGPAMYFARAGFAGSSIDGPHGGLRNVSHSDEQFLVFNFGNPPALRDNIRQSAAELALQAHVLDAVAIDVSDCPGAVAPQNLARFDTATMAIMGHSMGSSIAPLSAAVEPRFRAVLLSGAGSSFIENLIYKQKPLAVLPLAKVLLGLSGGDYQLSEYDPVLSMLQWIGEPADVPPYADRVLRHAKAAAPAVLMMQGIVDHYQMPPIANATSLAFGLDLAGDALDEKNAALAALPHVGDLLPLVERKRIALPAGANVAAGGGKVTAVLTQHPEDGVEDGHEVVFQTEGPKHEYVCLLKGLAAGAPRVPSPGKSTDPCD